MAREFKVMASSMTGTYSAGRFVAESAEDACDQARADYRNSGTGRALKDAGAFRFYTVSEFPHEQEAREEWQT